MPSYRYLSEATLGDIHSAAVKTGLASSRGTLLSGIEPDFVIGLPTDPSPANQLRQDLTALNAEERIDDGTVPLETWLSTAAQLAGPRMQAAVFRSALEQVRGIIAGTRSPAMGPRHGGGGGAVVSKQPSEWEVKLTGAEYESLGKALVAAFHTPEALREMVRFKLDKNLDAIVPGGGLRAVAFALIGEAEAQGWTRRLVVGALEANPGSPALLAFGREHGVVLEG